MMLANQLAARGCQVTLVTIGESSPGQDNELEAQSGASVVTIPEITESALEKIDLHTTDVLIGLMSDDNNLALCRLNHDRFGVEKVVMRFTEKIEEGQQWHQRGVIVLDPKTSLVSLLEHFVTSTFLLR